MKAYPYSVVGLQSVVNTDLLKNLKQIKFAQQALLTFLEKND